MKTIIILTSDTSSGLEAKVNSYLKEYKKYSVKVVNYTSYKKNEKVEFSGMIERENEKVTLISKVSKKNSKEVNNDRRN